MQTEQSATNIFATTMFASTTWSQALALWPLIANRLVVNSHICALPRWLNWLNRLNWLSRCRFVCVFIRIYIFIYFCITLYITFIDLFTICLYMIRIQLEMKRFSSSDRIKSWRPCADGTVRNQHICKHHVRIHHMIASAGSMAPGCEQIGCEQLHLRIASLAELA